MARLPFKKHNHVVSDENAAYLVYACLSAVSDVITHFKAVVKFKTKQHLFKDVESNPQGLCKNIDTSKAGLQVIPQFRRLTFTIRLTINLTRLTINLVLIT